MPETYGEQLDRIRLMSVADDNGTWDLSENDQAAIRAVLARLDYYERWARMMRAELQRLSDIVCEEDRELIVLVLEGPQEATNG